jgi:hypothetical protein
MIRLIIALCAILLATPADAQQRTGSRIGGTPARVRSERAEDVRMTLYEFGRCAVRTRPQLAVRTLAISPNLPEYYDELDAMAIDDCLSRGIVTVSDLVLRGALFQALLNARFADFQPTDMSAEPEIDYLAMHPGVMQSETRTIVGLNQFADCVFRASPVEARGLTIGMPNTAQETAHFTALRPHFAGCVPAGTSVQFSRTVLRNSLAEVIYHYAQSAAQRAEEEAAR